MASELLPTITKKEEKILKPKHYGVAVVLLALVLATIQAQSAAACTEFVLKAQDGGCVIGRSLEFGWNPGNQVVVHPRGERCKTDAPGGKPGITWTSKYGFLAFESFGYGVDGLNESGLSMGALYLPGYTKYQDAAAAKDPSKALAILDVCSWILGSFETAAQVKEAVQKVYVWGKPLKEAENQVFPLHISVYDAQGNGIVIEWVKEGLRIYDHAELGVLTNSPPFDWHLLNIGNYLNIRAAEVEAVKQGNTLVASPSQGSGGRGLPGDWTAPSRLVRVWFMQRFAKPVKDAAAGVNLAAHILNAVDIPLGDIRPGDNSFKDSDYTIWVAIKDLKNKVLYFRTYENLSLRAIDLKKLDLKPGAPKKAMPIQGGSEAVDVSGDLK
jgi:choloylglycine hydrolase